ncbi:MAG: type II toxin-antitoxin system RelE/ParE family toxin [Eubacteriales bacterium]|nr:type II toxin-antitoxin system RelE/ParE family toxin [Eubacteriales bacterium]
MNWTVEFLPEAEADFAGLDTSIQRQVFKGIQKVAQNPLPSFQGGYGKPLGNKDGLNLTNLLKIKFRDIGIRVVYKIIIDNGIMKIIIVSTRSDEKVYKEAARRRQKHDL